MVDVRWERTWPDEQRDFTALDTETGGTVGRVYYHYHGPKKGKWSWFLGSASGYGDSKQEAADAVRAKWKADCAARPELQDQIRPDRMRSPQASRPD